MDNQCRAMKLISDIYASYKSNDDAEAFHDDMAHLIDEADDIFKEVC